MRACAFIFVTTCAIFSAAFPGRGETITLSPVADTALFELSPDYNFGAQDDLPSGRLGAFASFMRSRVLIRFDLAANLPTNAIIQFAYLRFRVTRVPDEGGENSTFGLHRMLRPWGEGEQFSGRPGGGSASEGEATWNAAFHPSGHWTIPGGAPGIDFAEEFSSSERIQSDGEYQFDFGAAQVGELMQWLREPESNFGWMLISLSEEVDYTARRFGARENPDPAMRPQLVIEYSLSVAPKITAIEILPDGATQITFLVQMGFAYELQSTPAIGQSWQPASSVITPGFDGPTTLIDSSPPGVMRFYRVRRD